MREHFLDVIDERRILWRETDLLTYETDGVTLEKLSPALVLFPESTDEVQRIVQRCNEKEIPFLSRGAGTGLSGGALPCAEAVLLVLTRMNKILSIDPAKQTATAQAGAINMHVSRAAEQYGLLFAPDPSSGTAATIGGNIAENAGGPHCLKYGATAEHILAMTIVLPNGELLHTEADGPTGPLHALFLGSEGTLGIVTEATLRLLPIPEAVETLLVDFVTTREASEAVSAIIKRGIIPAALEMIDHEVLGALEEAFHLGLPSDAAAVLVVEMDGPKSSIGRLTKEIITILESNGARSVRQAANSTERSQLWQARKKAFGAIGRVSPAYYTQDGVIPRYALPDVLEEIYAIGKRYGLRIANIFHAGDGNLHPAILYDERDDAQIQAVLDASAEILKLCLRYSGSITGEHGVGLEKQTALGWMFDEPSIEMMRRVRSVFNPSGLLNPGKFLPTDHACHETGHKHRMVRTQEAS